MPTSLTVELAERAVGSRSESELGSHPGDELFVLLGRVAVRQELGCAVARDVADLIGAVGRRAEDDQHGPDYANRQLIARFPRLQRYRPVEATVVRPVGAARVQSTRPDQPPASPGTCEALRDGRSRVDGTSARRVRLSEDAITGKALSGGAHGTTAAPPTTLPPWCCASSSPRTAS